MNESAYRLRDIQHRQNEMACRGLLGYAASSLTFRQNGPPMKDLFRNLLSIRQKRRAPPVGPLPAVGSFIQRGPVKMAVTEPVPRELWDWLVLSGWRNLPVKTDRRKGLQAPQGALRQLIDADAQERNRAHSRVLEQAQPED